MNKKLKAGIITVSVLTGIVGGGIAMGQGIGALVTDLIGGQPKTQQKSDDLHLVAENAHLREGTHKVVLTHNFYNYMSYETTEEQQDMVIDAIKTAYDNLNSYSSNLKFELCTESQYLVEKYDLPRVPSVNKDTQIPLYITQDKIDNTDEILANTEYKIDRDNGRLMRQSVTFRKEYLFGTWSNYGKDGNYDIKDTFAYYITAHESMHLMGFDHIDKDSIMHTSIDYKYRDFTKFDKKLIAKYNEKFYGAELDKSTAKAKLLNTVATYTEEDEMSL